MTVSTRRVWRAAPTTCVLVWVFALTAVCTLVGNHFRTHSFARADLTAVAPGEDGLVVGSENRAFCRIHGCQEFEGRRRCAFPPYPQELRKVRCNPAAPRRRLAA
jgi:hypothetical protein